MGRRLLVLGLLLLLLLLLSLQDLPEYFEDQMSAWMPRFLELLTTENALLVSDDDEPGVMEELKSQVGSYYFYFHFLPQICDNIGLYAHKYEEEFQPYMQQFVTAVWNLLLRWLPATSTTSTTYIPAPSTGPSTKHDLLVSNAIQFLASVADRPHYKALFEDAQVTAPADVLLILFLLF